MQFIVSFKGSMATLTFQEACARILLHDDVTAVEDIAFMRNSGLAVMTMTVTEGSTDRETWERFDDAIGYVMPDYELVNYQVT